MAFPFVALFSTIGSFFSGIFGAKSKQAEVLQTALEVLKDVNASDAQKAMAAAQAIAADARSESVLTRVWRPMVMFIYLGFIISWWFGYAPTNILVDEMPPILEKLFDITEIVILAGYPARTLEKITRELNIGKVLKVFIEKNLL